MNNGYEHASQYQLFLCAYPHGKRVMPLACERVITCCVRAFTLFLEIPWRVTNYPAQKILQSKIWNPQESSDHTCHLKSGVPLLELFFFKVIKLPQKILAKIILPKKILKSKTLFTWSGGPRSSGVSFFCFVSPGAWKQKKLTPLDRGPPLHVNRL